MALSIVLAECYVDGNRAKVVIEGDSPSEVLGTEAKNLAIRHAASNGVHRPGCGVSGGSYPIDPSGQSSDPVAAANSGGCKYRCDWPIQGGL